MLGNERGKQLYHYVSDYVLFDLETTGISNIYDEVIEISAVKVRNGVVVEEFNELCTRCGMPMKKRNGKFGEFWGCSGYPNCKCTENI